MITRAERLVCAFVSLAGEKYHGTFELKNILFTAQELIDRANLLFDNPEHPVESLHLQNATKDAGGANGTKYFVKGSTDSLNDYYRLASPKELPELDHKRMVNKLMPEIGRCLPVDFYNTTYDEEHRALEFLRLYFTFLSEVNIPQQIIDSNLLSREAVWLAAATLTYNEYARTQSTNIENFIFPQNSIARLATVFNPQIAMATASQYTGRNATHNRNNQQYSYLIPMGDKRRIAAANEAAKTKPEHMNLSFAVNTIDGQKQVHEIIDFIDTMYTPFIDNGGWNKVPTKPEQSSCCDEAMLDKIRLIVNSYKENFSAIDKEERFKWEAISWYKQHWNIEAEDFATMLETAFSKTYGLLSGAMYYPYKMLVEYATADPEAVRNIFRTIHNEELSLTERYQVLVDSCQSYIEKKKMQEVDRTKNLQSFQDWRAFMVYLTFEYPDKHYLYKASMFADISKRIGFSEDKPKKAPPVWKIESYTRLCEIVLSELQKDAELISMHQSRLDANCYQDEALHLLTMDVLYYGSNLPMELFENQQPEIDSTPTYWPSLEEYNPGISAEDWVKFLTEDSKTYPATLEMLKTMLDLGGEATCKKLGEVLGEHPSTCVSRGNTLGRRAKKKFGLPQCMDGDIERFFPVPFVGHRVTEDGKNLYAWKLRPELETALTSMDLEAVGTDNSVTDIKLNTILYGPPGTGKTYYTVIYAVAIIENRELSTVEAEDYAEVLVRYNEYKASGRITFTTFHQSYGYEEFIEGIKPTVTYDSDTGGKGDVHYEVLPGIFKAFCDSTNPKVKTFDDAWDELIDNAVSQDNKYTFTRRTKSTLQAVLRDENTFVVNWSGGTSNTLKKDRVYEQWANNDYENRSELRGGKRWMVEAIQAVIDELTQKYGLPSGEIPTERKNYVFIIDEINRGNISKIFGELITLIEPTKRIGQDEELQVVLPYSQKLFGVPNNVYIIGTMNTADRSIATIDTALRRRFQFKEMMPNPDVLADISVEGLSIKDMLDRMNKRIEVLYDREHTIGHAYFMPLKDNPTLDVLAEIFTNNIIPLLQKYFYEDYEKIRLILGDSQKEEAYQFITAKENDYVALFGDVDVGLDDGVSYKINYEAFKTEEAYRSIL